MLIRLDKYLADMQVGTRSEVKELIRKKRVTVNDNIVTKPESKINTDGDSVNVDGNAVGYLAGKIQDSGVGCDHHHEGGEHQCPNH